MTCQVCVFLRSSDDVSEEDSEDFGLFFLQGGVTAAAKAVKRHHLLHIFGDSTEVRYNDAAMPLQGAAKI